MKPEGKATNRLQILRDILSYRPVPSGGAALELPVDEHQLDREPIEFRLRHILEWNIGTQPFLDALVELRNFLRIHGGFQREHGRQVCDLPKLLLHFARYSLRGRVGSDERRVLSLERKELSHEPIVASVRDLGCALHIVEEVVMADFPTELFKSFRGLIFRHRRPLFLTALLASRVSTERSNSSSLLPASKARDSVASPSP